MLTADLVHVRRRADRLQVVPLDDHGRARARALGAAYLELARAHVGAPRGALLESCRAVPVAAPEQRLAKGLLKLVLDRCQFEEGAALDPAELRRALFGRAAAVRREGAAFDRADLVAAVAAERGTSPQDLERSLYADLPDAHLLRGFDDCAPEALVRIYDAAQVQAVLLRAVRLTAVVRGAAPGAYRDLFRKLKFLRLLHTITALPRGGGFRIDIDGPYSLFEAVTKYGLQLALAYPALTACGAWDLEAELRWGREQRPMRFQLRGEAAAGDATQGLALPDEVSALLAQLQALDTPWRADVADAVIDLPGVGLCIPDLVFRHADTGAAVFLEVLGFWSRDAVWKRIELAERGLPAPVVFAVSKHLRVSEAALDDDAPARLYVYSRAMNARAVLERVEAVGGKPQKRRSKG